MLKAILTGDPYPVRAWVAIGGNPLLTWSNTKEVYRALMKLDFFMGVDLFMNPSLQLADIVLPAPTHFEKERLMETHGYGPYGNVRCVRAVEPLGEVRDEFEVCGDILRRMGMDRNWPWHTVVEFYNRGGYPNEALDPLIRPLNLSETDMDDLVAFLKSLTGDNTERVDTNRLKVFPFGLSNESKTLTFTYFPTRPGWSRPPGHPTRLTPVMEQTGPRTGIGSGATPARRVRTKS